jgi:hypothetical protein
MVRRWEGGKVGRSKVKGQRKVLRDFGIRKVECGLRPVGAIRAYAPEGSWKSECGLTNQPINQSTISVLSDLCDLCGELLLLNEIASWL